MIDRFEREYHFLSNFHPSPIIYKGRRYRTVEHAFQSAKCVLRGDLLLVQRAKTPMIAKQIGGRVKLREGWDDLRIVTMIDLIHLKFRDPVLRAKLMATFPDQLVEGNNHGDRYWGTVHGDGQNALGKILMAERAELMR